MIEDAAPRGGVILADEPSKNAHDDPGQRKAWFEQSLAPRDPEAPGVVVIARHRDPGDASDD